MTLVRWMIFFCLSLVACQAADTPPNVRPAMQAHTSLEPIRYAGPMHPVSEQTIELPDNDDAVLQGTILILQHETGRYLGTPIGGGAFGQVYAAVDEMGTPWAIKAMPRVEAFGTRSGLAVSEESVRREFGLWQSVRDDFRVASLLASDYHFFAVVSLQDDCIGCLAPDTRRQADVARSVLYQVAHDAARLHNLGFVHHDLRSHNILWRANGTIMLADYGLAAQVDDTGTLEAAPWMLHEHLQAGARANVMFQAPEVGEGPYDAKVDVWSLGLTLFEMSLPEFWMYEGLVVIRMHQAPFERWRQSILNSWGRVDLERIVDPHTHPVPLHQWYFQALAFHLKELDPALCDIALSDLLVADPAARTSMALVAEHAAHLLDSNVLQRAQEALQQAKNPHRAETLAALTSLLEKLPAPPAPETPNSAQLTVPR